MGYLQLKASMDGLGIAVTADDELFKVGLGFGAFHRLRPGIGSPVPVRDERLRTPNHERLMFARAMKTR